MRVRKELERIWDNKSTGSGTAGIHFEQGKLILEVLLDIRDINISILKRARGEKEDLLKEESES